MSKKTEKNDEIDFVIAEEGVGSGIELSEATGTHSSASFSPQSRLFGSQGRWAVAALLLCSVLYYLFYMVFGQSRVSDFPLIEPGSYLGVIERGIGANSDEPSILYVERDTDMDSIFFAILRAGFKPANFHVSASGPLAPLTLVSTEGKLRFTGRMVSTGLYSGEVENLDTESIGSWTLSNIPAQLDLKMSPEAAEEVLRWLTLRAELRYTESRIKLAESTVPEQKQEIEKLTEYLTEGRVLKERSDKKLRVAQSELSDAQEKLLANQKEADKLAKQLEISQKVTDAGKLVSLSRDSLERERRWIESMFKTSSSDGSSDLVREIERGEKVLDLRAKIAEAKNKLSRLIYERERGITHGAPEALVPGEVPTENVDVFTGNY